MPPSASVRARQALALVDQSSSTTKAEPTSNALILTEVRTAERTAERNKNRIVLAVPGDEWRVYTDGRWQLDELRNVQLAVVENARSYLADAADEEDKTHRRDLITHATRMESHRGVMAVCERLKAIPGVAVSRKEFDRDPLLFNVRNGTINLESGVLRPHDASDQLTKMAQVTFIEDARCPRYDAFLDRIVDGDVEMIAFPQRLLGYLLTGLTNEQAMFFFYGLGANGKTVLIETWRALLGEYATQADISSFLLKKFDGGPRNDIARLEGARLVTCTEIPDGKRLDEPLIKSVTGSDVITARLLYKEPIEFQPVFKLVMAGNHKPMIRGTDNGIWRRLRMVPFAVAIPEHERDPNLTRALRAELSGILNWALQGCRDWRTHGLMPPSKVMAATRDYRESSDTFRVFLADCCAQEEHAATPFSELWKAYTEWAGQSGEHAMSRIKFGQTLTERGFAAVERGNKKVAHRLGISLNVGDLRGDAG